MNKSNLILHAGANAVERAQVVAVPLPPRTQSWVPLAHHKFLEGVQNRLQEAGLSVVTEAHGLTRDGARYFGLLQVQNGHIDNDFGLVVGLRNSHDKSFPASLAVGSAVFVCDNLAFSAEIRLARKHTVNLTRDLPKLIDTAVGRLGDLRRSQEQRFNSYRQHELTDAAAHDLVIRALDSGVVPVTRVPAVLTEWRNPRHAEFREGKTAWRLFNGFTEALKGNLDALPKRTVALHGLLDTACGLATSVN